MKLIMENWRQFSEDTDPTAQETRGSALDTGQIEDLITDKFSFNSLRAPDHRFTPGQPVVDYSFDEQANEWNFIAWTGSEPEKAKEAPDLKAEKGETLEVFLTRVKEASSQLTLFETKRGNTAKLIMEQWRKYIIQEDSMGFVHQMAKSHQESGFKGGRLGKQLGREIKQAFSDHADHEFLSTLDTVHWADLYGLEALAGKGKDELSATMSLPGDKFRNAGAYETGLWIKGRITLASNSQDKLYSGFYGDYGSPHEGDPEAVKHRDKSSGRNKRPSVGKDFSRYDKLEPGNEYMEKMARNHTYVLDRSTWKPEGTNEALVDNWTPKAIVVFSATRIQATVYKVASGALERSQLAGKASEIFNVAEKFGLPIVSPDRGVLWKPENA